MKLSPSINPEQTKDARTVFFGTPEFAIPSLQQLIDHTNVVGCVTQPDKPVGRHGRLTAPPIQRVAQANKIPLFQPHTLSLNTESGSTFLKQFQSLQPDIAVVVAYGKIIPKEYLAVPRFGFLNVHASLLPAYRGASPMQHAILHGEKKTGVSIMVLDEGLDTGPVLAQSTVTISNRETTQSLHDRLAVLGAALLVPTLVRFMTGELVPQPQDHSRATLTTLIARDDGEIDWSADPVHIERMIRAFSPWPGAVTSVYGKRIKILRAHLDQPNRLMIDMVQPEGKKAMSYTDFLRGYPQYLLPPTSI